MDWAPAEDFTMVCDNLDTMTLKVSGQSDVALTSSVLTKPIDRKETEPADGQVPQADLLAVWPVSLSARPPLGSVLVDEDGVYWTILTVQHRQHAACWAARCRNLSVVSAATNIATLLVATYVHGNAGEARAIWVGAVSGERTPTDDDQFPARFQPSATDAVLRYGGEFSKSAYRVIFDNPAPIDVAGNEYRIIDSEGYRYRVLSYANEERIDKLPVAIAVRITEGREYHVLGPGA